MKIVVDLKEHGYPIYIEEGMLSKIGEMIHEKFKCRKIMIVSDDNVFPLYGQEMIDRLEKYFVCDSVVIPHGEKSKNIQTLPEIYQKFLEAKLTRSDLVIALGGGVVGDIAGFAAATYLRGVPYVQVPTSLLAQVDSSVGGKTAVDLGEGKNLVGAFYQPKMVVIDPNVLDTLPKRYLSDGMGEVIKYGCIMDAELFSILEGSSLTNMKEMRTEIIARCVNSKRIVVEKDEFDTGDRLILNFGHTIGHAIEQAHAYSKESHGEAVGIGMYQLTALAEQMNLTEQGTSQRIKNLLNLYELPTECNMKLKDLKKVILLDKKNLDHKLKIILIRRIGESYIFPTDTDFFDLDKMI